MVALPPSLRFTPPTRTKPGYKIARKEGLKYLRMRITHCHNNIKALTTTLQELTLEHDSKLSREHLRAIQETVKQSTTAFHQLINKKKDGRSPPVVDKEK